MVILGQLIDISVCDHFDYVCQTKILYMNGCETFFYSLAKFKEK